MVFGTDVERVTSTCVKTDTGVDAQNSITLTFKDGKIAVLHSSMLSMTDRQGIISGDKGHLIIENINNPQRIRVVTEDYKTGSCLQLSATNHRIRIPGICIHGSSEERVARISLYASRRNPAHHAHDG